MGNNSISTFYTFHEGQTIADNGNIMTCGANDVLMVISVTGNATGFNLSFPAKSHYNDVYTPIKCVNLETLALSTSATSNGKYQMSLEGLCSVKIDLTSITSGAVTVIGTVVN